MRDALPRGHAAGGADAISVARGRPSAQVAGVEIAARQLSTRWLLAG